MVRAIITGTGSYIPKLKVENKDFLDEEFFSADGEKIQKSNEEIISKFQDITCIKERRYVTDDLTTSDIAFEAAKEALEGVDKESLDYIIVAHNLGDGVKEGFCDTVPTIAARVKHRLKI